MKQSSMPRTFKRIVHFAFLGVILTSCSYTLYKRNLHELKVAKKTTYLINYSTVVPVGVEAKITYTDQYGKPNLLEHVTGKWIKEVNLKSGDNCVFIVHIDVAKMNGDKMLVTSLMVNGEEITRQTQTGRSVIFNIGFKLP